MIYVIAKTNWYQYNVYWRNADAWLIIFIGTIGLNNWLESTMGPEVGGALLPSWFYAASGLIALIAGGVYALVIRFKHIRKKVFG